MNPDNGSHDGRPLANWPRPLAFVLSGGASYGAVQVGMLRALTDAGIHPDLVIGSSVGALNGVRFASDPATAHQSLVAIWESMWQRGVIGGRSRMGRLWAAARNGLQRNSVALFEPTKLNDLVAEHLSARLLEELTIPTAVVATDALVGQPKIFRHGSIGPILQATAAVPGLFPPVKIDGCYYIDGGVSANLPIQQAVEVGARSLVVLNALPAAMAGTVPNSIVGSMLHASAIMLRNQRADADEQLMGKQPILHLPRPTPPSLDPFDFTTSAGLIEAGYESTRSFLERVPELADPTKSAPAPRREAPPADGPVPPPPTGWRPVGL